MTSPQGLATYACQIMRKPNQLRNKKILITYGPTWIPVDTTRIISNISTGALGRLIARKISRSGAKITVLEGPVAEPLKNKSVAVRRFSYYSDFAKLINQELKKPYDIVIHAAAVADYKLKNPRLTKISSHHRSLSLELVPTKKIIYSIKKRAPKSCLVGFKLTSPLSKTSAARKAEYLFRDCKCDLVVVNSANSSRYRGFLINKDGSVLAEAFSRENMAKIIIKNLEAGCKNN